MLQQLMLRRESSIDMAANGMHRWARISRPACMPRKTCLRLKVKAQVAARNDDAIGCPRDALKVPHRALALHLWRIREGWLLSRAATAAQCLKAHRSSLALYLWRTRKGVRVITAWPAAVRDQPPRNRRGAAAGHVLQQGQHPASPQGQGVPPPACLGHNLGLVHAQAVQKGAGLQAQGGRGDGDALKTA